MKGTTKKKHLFFGLLAVFLASVTVACGKTKEPDSASFYADPYADSLTFGLSFDDAQGLFVQDAVTLENAEIEYVFADAKFKEDEADAEWVNGSAVSGACLAFDGYSNSIAYPSVQIGGSKLTVDVFVSPRAFEWDEPGAVENDKEHLQVIVGQFDKEQNAGFVLGMHKYGAWSFQLGLGDTWFKIWNEWNPLDKYTWNHLTCVYDGETGRIAIYKNGEIVNESEAPVGSIKPCDGPLYIGKSSAPQYTGVYELNMFNGLMDELKIYSAAKDERSIAEYHESYCDESGKLPAVSFTDGWLDGSVLEDDIYRPQYHATPPRHWMNEPHALFYYNGNYHLFYQFNLTGPYWRQICWGHWVSPDMVQWRNVKEAIVMDEDSCAPDGIWSGNAAYKEDGTPVLFITAGNDSRDENPYSNQNVAIAVPKDLSDPDLTEWVLSDDCVATLNKDMGAANEFRDPNIYYEDGVWYMLVSGRLHNDHGTAYVYTTEDDSFTDWTYRGTLFKPEIYEPYMGQTWELVNLAKLENDAGTKSKYIFIFSPAGNNADNDVYYYLGDFDKETCRFIPETEKPQLMDYGNNVFTGPTVATDPNTDMVLICSIIQDQRSGRDEYNAGWAHSAGIPRRLSLDDNGELAITPIPQLSALYGETLLEKENVAVSEINADMVSGFGDMLYLSFEIEAGDATAFGLAFKKGEGKESKLIYDAVNGNIALDTTNSGNTRVKGVFGGELALNNGVLKVEMYIDNAMVECYVNGKKTLTAMIYNPSDGMEFFSDGNSVVKSCKIIAMNGI